MSCSSFGRWAWLLAIGLVLTQAALLASDLEREYRRTLDTEYARLADAARIADENISGSLRAIDLLLRDVGAELDRRGPAASAAMAEYMLTRARAFPEVRTVLFTSPEGIITATTRPELLGMDVHDRPYYAQVHESADRNRTFFSQLVRAKPSNVYVIFVTRALPLRDGQWAGVVSASLDLNMFHSMLATIRPDEPNSWISLDGIDGQIISRAPEPERVVGFQLGKGSVVEQHLVTGQKVSFNRLVTPTDHVDKIFADRTVADGSYVVAVTRAFPAVMAPWWREATIQCIEFFSLSIAMFSLTWLAVRHHDKEARARASAEKAHDAQLASEERFRRLFEDNKAIQMLVDPDDGRIVDANHAAAKFYGYSRDRLRTMTIFEINTLDPAMLRASLVSIRDRHLDFFTFRHRLASGEVRDVEVRTGPLDFADRIVLCSTIHDISARRQAEAARSRLAAIVESSGDAIIGKSIDGTINSWNQGAESIYGYRAEEIVGQPIDALASADRQGEAFQLIAVVLRGEPVSNHETIRRRKDGTLFNVSLTLSPIRDEQGALVGISTIARDITQRKQTEAELQRYRENLEALVEERTAALTETNRRLAEAKDRAEAANAAKTIFLANMSHEIRTPMNAILGFAQIMQRSATLDAVDRGNVDVISRSGRNLLVLINDILEMSKVEAGRTEYSPCSCDLHALLDDLGVTFKMATGAKGLRWELALAPDLQRWVVTDEGKLRQILINILGNAVKFTDVGGVVLRARTVATGAAGQRLAVEVEDTGPGIDTTDQQLLFEAFQQAPTGTARGGTGLGLALSRRFARLMGGDITVTSTPGHGSVFRLDVPVSLGTPTNKPSAHAHRRVLGVRSGAENIRILIVDDKADNRLFLRCLLDPLGFGLREATNGREAVAAAGEWQPHVILMDIVMPVMGGHEAVRRIRAAPGGREVRIIALSASAFEEDREAVLASGADDFVRKPVTAETLLETIRALTGIEYDYTEGATEPSAPALTTVLLPEIRSRLPAETLDAMRRAVYRSDDHGLALLINGLPPDLNDIAQVLHHAVSKFDWDTLEGFVGTPPP